MRQKFIFSSSLFVLGCLLAAATAFGGEKKEKDPPPVVVRERTVYVPYEKLKETFEKEGRGVFLPYEEFLKLWNAAQPKKKEKKEIKPPADAAVTGGSYAGKAGEKAVRFEVTFTVRALAEKWASVPLPLKNVAVETVKISDPAAVFAPQGDGYVLIAPKPGEYTLTLAFSVRVEESPGRRRIAFGIPPTAVSRLEMDLPGKDLRVEVEPKMAATVTEAEGENTKVLAFVGNAKNVAVTWRPPEDKVEKGEALVIASQAVQAELGERILRLNTACAYRIERQETDTFRVKLPADMRLLSVKGANIREWNTENGVLIVRLHSPVKNDYALALRFERILEKTPEELNVPFPVTEGTLREDGYVTISNEPALRVRVDRSTGLSQIDPRELPKAMRGDRLLAGFRYLAHPVTLNLKIEPVQPQVRSHVSAIASLGLDEDVMAGWVDFQIAKVGIFTVKLKFPSRWEVASVGDKATVEDFQIAADATHKTLTVNLKNQALGNFRLPFRLTAPGSASPGEKVLEAPQVLDTKQDRGLFGVSAPKAYKLTTVERTKMASGNVQLLRKGELLNQWPQDHAQPLTYTYTQTPASVKISLERRKTEIRVTGFHVVTVADSGLKVSHELKYFIEFAATDSIRFSLPTELDEDFHVKCANLKEKKRLSEAEGRSVWELTLQDKLLGPLSVLITHEKDLKNVERDQTHDIAVPVVRAEEVQAQQGYVTICKDGSLEIDPQGLKSLEPIESVQLPGELRRGNLYLSYRYFQPDYELTLNLKRHNPVEMTKTVVDLLRMTAVVSREQKVIVRAVFFVETRGDQYLELRLPPRSQIRALSVNRSPVTAKQRSDGVTLVELAGGGVGKPFPVDLVYAQSPEEGAKAMGAAGGLTLTGPTVPGGLVPVNKIEYDLYLPEDYSYWSFGGTLHRRELRDSNTLVWLAGGDHERTAQYGHQFKTPPQPLGQFITQGRVFRFETMAPVAELSFSYCGHKLVVFLDILLALAVIALGVFMIRIQKRSRLSVGLGCLLVPMVLTWYTTGDAEELWMSATMGGAILAIALLLLALKQRLHEWRELRIQTAPDPFLEDAPDRSESKEPEEAPQDAKPEDTKSSDKSDKPDEAKPSDKSAPSDSSEPSDSSDEKPKD